MVNGTNTWPYIWGNSIFTSKKAYCHLIGASWAHPMHKWIWKSSCQHKRKVFFWLLSKARLSTRNILKRKNLQLASFNCVLCANDSETVEHLFLDCGLAKACWSLIGVIVNNSINPFQIFEDFRRQLNVPFFMEIIIIMSWRIWAIRNDAIFRRIPASSSRCLEIFRLTFCWLLWRAKKKYFPHIKLWLKQLV